MLFPWYYTYLCLEYIVHTVCGPMKRSKRSIFWLTSCISRLTWNNLVVFIHITAALGTSSTFKKIEEYIFAFLVWPFGYDTPLHSHTWPCVTKMEMALVSQSHTRPSVNGQPLPPLPLQGNGPQHTRHPQLWSAQVLSGLQWGSSSARSCSREIWYHCGVPLNKQSSLWLVG